MLWRRVGDGFFAGAKQYKYIRAFYGLSVSTAIALITTFLTKPESEEKMRGLVWGTINAALAHYKGSPGQERDSTKDYAQAQQGLADESPQGSAALAPVALSAGLAQSLSAQEGDLVYVSDRRWWLGGLRSGQGIVVEVRSEVKDKQVFLGQSFFADLVGAGREAEPLLVERLY